MVYEFPNDYPFRTPALQRLNDRLIALDQRYVREGYADLAVRAAVPSDTTVTIKGDFPLRHRIRLALLIIIGP